MSTYRVVPAHQIRVGDVLPPQTYETFSSPQRVQNLEHLGPPDYKIRIRTSDGSLHDFAPNELVDFPRRPKGQVVQHTSPPFGYQLCVGDALPPLTAKPTMESLLEHYEKAMEVAENYGLVYSSSPPTEAYLRKAQHDWQLSFVNVKRIRRWQRTNEPNPHLMVTVVNNLNDEETKFIIRANWKVDLRNTPRFTEESTAAPSTKPRTSDTIHLSGVYLHRDTDTRYRFYDRGAKKPGRWPKSLPPFQVQLDPSPDGEPWLMRPPSFKSQWREFSLLPGETKHRSDPS